MEGIINYLSEAEEIERLTAADKKLQSSFPKAVSISWEESELERL